MIDEVFEMARYGFSIGGVIRIVTGFLLLTCLLASCGQGTAYLDWQRCLGGSQNDYGECIQQTADGGYIAAGYAASWDGDVRGGHAGYDYLIVKFDASHNVEWQKSLGGSEDDMAYSIQQTKDGGYVVAGCTNSAGHTDSDGDVSGKHGYNDYWVVRLDSKGNVKWQKCLGGGKDEKAYSIRETSDGGYIVAGTTNSNNGDVSGIHGGSDCWIVKLNDGGKLIWQKCLGGSDDDVARCVQQTKDGGYIVAGTTNSNNGDVSGNHGGSDCWMVKLDSNGNIKWQKCYGGSDDDAAYSIQQIKNGQYIFAGCTNSAGHTYSDGDVIDNHGYNDYWVVSLNDGGKIIWEDCLGGGKDEKAYSIQQTKDDGYIVAGTAMSNGDDVSGNHGGSDCWIVKLNWRGDITWQKCLGGSNEDGAYSVQQTKDGGYIIAGYTHSIDGDIRGRHTGFDCWIVKLSEINGAITASDAVCAESGGNVASTAEPGASYSWSIANGKITSLGNARSITFTAGASGTMRLTVNVTKRDGSWSECSKDIAIKPQPRCSWTSTSPVCNGMPVQFTGPGGLDSYKWDFGDGAVSRLKDEEHLYRSPGIYTVSLSTTKDGCSESCTGTVEVEPAQICSWTSNSPVCNGTAVQFIGPAGMDSYQWSFGDGAVSSYENTSHLYGAPGIYKVRLNGIKDGCSGSCERTVEVRPPWACNPAPIDIEWQRSLGGSNQDGAYSIQKTKDGGYIVAGYSHSINGDVSGRHTGYDCWIVKLNASHNIEWQKCLGGSNDEMAYSVQQTKDGGYIVAGYTNSIDGDVRGRHDVRGRRAGYDCWVVKLDMVGNIEWQKCLGGSSDDVARSIQQTKDGGYIVAGLACSDDGDLSGNHGGYTGTADLWVVKLDTGGNIEWQKCLGGSNEDGANSIQQTKDGGYIIAGYTHSIDGDVRGRHTGYDCWVVKLDADGNKEWQKCLGGSADDSAESIQQTSDGGYIVAGNTSSNNGDVRGNHGMQDAWVVKLNDGGNIEWQKCLGGSADDSAESIQQTSDGGYIVAGYTSSKNGDVGDNRGGLDYWVVKLSEINSTITAPDSVSSGSTGLEVKVTKADGSLSECCKDIAILSGPDCVWASNSSVNYTNPVQFTGPAVMDRASGTLVTDRTAQNGVPATAAQQSAHMT
jgi:hypothetical protein